MYFAMYYLHSKSGKLHILFSVTVNLETSISNLGRFLLRNNCYIRSTLFLTKSSALLKIVKKIIYFLREGAVFNIVAQFNINKTQGSLQ